jgi:hypothetical protein
LSGKVTNFTDMCLLDDMIQDILSESWLFKNFII